MERGRRRRVRVMGGAGGLVWGGQSRQRAGMKRQERGARDLRNGRGAAD